VHSARSFHLVVALATLLLLLNTVLFKEEFVRHVQIRVITDLWPSTEAMSVDANQEHSIFLGAPSARIASSFCRIRKTERVPVTVTADGLSKKLKLLGSFDGCLGVHLLEIAKVNQNRFAILLGEALSKSLLFLNHLCIIVINSFTSSFDELIENRLHVVLISLFQFGLFDDLLTTIIHRSVSEVRLNEPPLFLISQRSLRICGQLSTIVFLLVSLLLLTLLETVSSISLLSVTTLDSGSSRCAFSRYLSNIGFVLLLFLFRLNLGDLVSRNNLIPVKIDVVDFDVGDLHEVIPVNSTSAEVNLVVNLGLGDFSILKDRVNIELFETLLVATQLKHLGGTHFEHHLNILR
jgi:hypothetical protein